MISKKDWNKGVANIYIKLKHSNTAFNNDDTYTYHSFTLLKKGCDMNHGPSCGALGAIISLSNADLPAAKQLLKKGCDLGNQFSCNKLNLENQQN